MMAFAGVMLFGSQHVSAQAAAVAPTVSTIIFAPNRIASGATSQMSIVFSNPNEGAATLTQTFIDSLPAGLTLAGAGGGSCPGAVGGSTGGGALSYAAGATIPSGGCTISASVRATTAANGANLTNAVAPRALQTNFGASASGASASLTVKAAVNVPSVAGLTQTAAATVLQSVGLTLGAVTRAISPTPYNLVFAQTPAANSAVAAGSAVSITLSNGPNGVPNTHSPLVSSGNVAPEQVSVAAAVERVCANLQTPGAVLSTNQANLLANCRAIINTYGGSSDANGLKGALDAVSGKQSTAQQRTGVQFSGTQFANIGARLAQVRQGATGANFSGLDTGVPMQGSLGQLLAFLKGEPDADSSKTAEPTRGGGAGDGDSPSNLSRWGFFINGRLRNGSEDTTADETGFDFRSSGVTAGVDYRINDHFVVGLAAGHSNGNTKFVDGSGRLDSRSNSGSLYGSYYNDAIYVDVIGTFGHISYDAKRTTTYAVDPTTTGGATNCTAGTCTIDTEGTTGARQLAFGGSAGYNFYFGGLTLGPDADINYTRVDVNGFTENDPLQTGMALSYGDQEGESLLLKAGGHFSYAISTPIAVILPQVRAHYVHEFKNDQRALTVHYVDDPTVTSVNGPVSNFSVFTDKPDRGYFDWSAGMTAQFAFGLAAFVDYSALAGYTQLTTHELTFGVRFQYAVR
jgi:uncharacterized protein YhjY with autotransporter beta-barrel domain